MHITQTKLHNINFIYALGEVSLAVIDKSKYMDIQFNPT